MPEDSVKRNPAPCPGRPGGLHRAAGAGDGVFTAADAKFALFKIEITNADGTTSVVTLAQAGITSINLKADLTSIDYADGSMITRADHLHPLKRHHRHHGQYDAGGGRRGACGDQGGHHRWIGQPRRHQHGLCGGWESSNER